jgi:hypothetical protein
MTAEFSSTTRHASDISLLGARGAGKRALEEMRAVITSPA